MVPSLNGSQGMYLLIEREAEVIANELTALRIVTVF